MKIVSLQAENFKRLKAVEITPDGNTVVISGKNAQGKSSVLDAIWAALAGGKGGAVQRPVRDGQRKARVRLDLGDVVVERKWSGERTSLEVTAASGAKFPSPQKMLDDLIGSLSFDPLAFATQDGKRQRKTLIDLVPEDAAELDRIADERKQAYDARTLVNRDVKTRRAQVDAIDFPDDTPDEEVDVVALAGEVQAASQAVQRRETLLAEHALNKREIERLQARQAEIVEEGKSLKWATEDHVAALTTRLSEVDAANRHVRAKQTFNELYESLRNAEVESSRLSDVITLADEKRDEIIAGLKLPVPGLSFDEEGVLYNGVPFVQASAAERLRVSVAMAMALNPEIRVIRITDGSLLDSDNMALIEEMAADKDFQVWVERVSDGEDVGVVIEDGEVRA